MPLKGSGCPAMMMCRLLLYFKNPLSRQAGRWPDHDSCCLVLCADVVTVCTTNRYATETICNCCVYFFSL
ncbi:hypothetical protein chiPu_0017070 [Chiloscyllium punctatum]|uniref:Uncharacterized protein n=1 Tax=Chiloscyllium punctatum TaxID=137246 RepID=A0A401T7G8_CHIPU|nr:hypothetical protein [Chiloscyllium punctatum]